jgi:hypothetical protein
LISWDQVHGRERLNLSTYKWKKSSKVCSWKKAWRHSKKEESEMSQSWQHNQCLVAQGNIFVAWLNASILGKDNPIIFSTKMQQGSHRSLFWIPLRQKKSQSRLATQRGTLVVVGS